MNYQKYSVSQSWLSASGHFLLKISKAFYFFTKLKAPSDVACSVFTNFTKITKAHTHKKRALAQISKISKNVSNKTKSRCEYHEP